MEEDITGRDALIIAEALFEAAYLLRNREPAHLRQPSNARDMEKILFAYYPEHAKVYALQHLLGRAMALGYEQKGELSEEGLIEFILSKDPGAHFVGEDDPDE